MPLSNTKDSSHLAKKVRVYELAREPGLDNSEALELCESLGIGVKHMRRDKKHQD